MGEALLWGLVAGSSLLLGAAMAYVLDLSERAVGLLMGFGAGTLISAVSYELVSDASELAGGQELWIGLATGALVFFFGKRALGSTGGSDDDPKAIVLGTVLDGIPEGIVLGMSLIAGGGGSAAVIGAVFMSNIPEATSSTNELKKQGRRARGIFAMWLVIALATAVSALLGYGLFDTAPNGLVAFTQAFAGGALLAMLSMTMIPEAHEKGQDVAGLATVLGFAVAFALAELA